LKASKNTHSFLHPNIVKLQTQATAGICLYFQAVTTRTITTLKSKDKPYHSPIENGQNQRTPQPSFFTINPTPCILHLASFNFQAHNRIEKKSFLLHISRFITLSPGAFDD
jgi:hypothetical protein